MRRVAHLLLLIGLAVLAWQALAFSLAIAGLKDDPKAAAKIAPGNALVLAALARSELTRNPAAAGEAAERALRRDPTRATAAGVLGLTRAQAGDMRHATALLDYSQAMSRRDIPTQLWAIENAVQQGDIAKALHHYDIALRVGRTTPALLFPVLTSASDDPEIRAPLVALLRRPNVPWRSSFLDYFGARTTNIVSASQFLIDLYAARADIPRGPVNILIQRLMEANEVDRAWALYARANPGATRVSVRNGSFDQPPVAGTLFDWQLEDLGEARAEILPGEKGGELHIEARSGAGGVVARQRLALPPGSYVLSLGVRIDDGGTLGESSVELFCEPSRQKMGQMQLGTVARQRRGEARFAVADNCSSQSIEIRLYAGAAEATMEGVLDDILIRSTSGVRSLQ
jgi:hypothetical protein